MNAENSKQRDCIRDKKEFERNFEKTQAELVGMRDDYRVTKERLRDIEIQLGKH